MATIVYAHDGTNVYDTLFLEQLARENNVYFLTFSKTTEFVPKNIKVVKMHEPFLLSSTRIELFEGLRTYLLSFLRSFLLWSYLRRLQPDILLGCMATKYGFYSAISRFKPFILIIWGSDVLVAPKRFIAFRFMATFSIRRADAVILDSEVQKKAAVELGCQTEKVLKFPWFDLKDVQIRLSRIEVRKRLGWQNNPIVISLRRHDPICGVQYVFEAIPHIIKVIPEARFLIIGDGPLTEGFKRMVRGRGMEKYVKFIGRVSREDAISYLNASDVNLSASLSDGTSASLLEAMTMKIPSIVTSIPGNVEWIENGFNGYLVPVKDSQQLAEKVIFLLKDERFREQIGENAFETVSKKVDWHKNSMALMDLISRLLRESK